MPSYKDDSNGTWYCQFWYKNSHGERKHKTKHGFIRKRDADAWEREFKSHEKKDTVTFDMVASEFEQYLLNEVEIGNLKKSTYSSKKSYFDKHIKNAFNGVPIENIKTKEINKWLNDLTYDKEMGKRRSSSTINIIRNIMSQVFKYATANYDLGRNPVYDSINPRFHTNDVRVKTWTFEQYEEFFSTLNKFGYRELFDSMMFAGLRIGEALALTPSDIYDNKISVTKTLVFTKGSSVTITPPKTKSSIREVPIAPTLYKEIRYYIEHLYKPNPTDRIFPFSFSGISSYMDRQSRKLGLPHASPHTLRHSYASNLYNITRDLVVVAHNMGHSQPYTESPNLNNLTDLKVYIHPTQEAIESSAMAFEEYLAKRR